MDDTSHAWVDDTLRTMLLATAAHQQPGAGMAVSFTLQLGARVAEARGGGDGSDSAVVGRLMRLARERGSRWPTRSVVGAAGVRAVYLLASRDTALARVALHRMMEAGPAESFAPDVATLEDEVRLMSGRKQIYATQLRDGTLQPFPTEDVAHVEMRRQSAGLPPLERAACELRATR